MTDEDFQREVSNLASSPAVARIFETILNKQAEAFLLTTPEQTEHRERIHAYVTAVLSLQRSLSSIASDPKVLEFNRRLAAKQSVR
jgi:hypothetical protein